MNATLNPSGRGIDVIGDVHGHADRLRALLRRMGYEARAGAWTHPERIALFIGDLIDRGPAQVETVMTVRRMVEAGAAIQLMGNHEFNAIGFGTAHPGRPGHLRRRTEKNEFQHRAFLAETGLDTDLHREMLGWFAKLPTHLSFGGFRFAHACWDPGSVVALGGPEAGFLDRNRIPDYFTGHDPVREAADIVLKGPEASLPPETIYRDAYGIERDKVRLAWWRRGIRTMAGMAVPEEVDLSALELVPAPDAWRFRQGGPLTFVGHYWMKGEPALVAEDVVCVDFSVAKGGVLAAYRLEPDDRKAESGRFVWV